jgi:hypothetical protein
MSRALILLMPDTPQMDPETMIAEWWRRAKAERKDRRIRRLVRRAKSWGGVVGVVTPGLYRFEIGDITDPAFARRVNRQTLSDRTLARNLGDAALFVWSY